MITLAVVITLSLLAGIFTTARFYEKQITEIKKAHNAALITEFHRSFNAGWVEGTYHGRSQERLDQITNRLLAKS